MNGITQLRSSETLLYLVIFGCAGSLLLSGLFSSCGNRELLSSCSVWASQKQWLLWLWNTGFRVQGLSSCHSQALEHRFSSCGVLAYLLLGMWDLPGPGIKPVSPALTDRFPCTVPPGKSLKLFFCLARDIWDSHLLLYVSIICSF